MWNRFSWIIIIVARSEALSQVLDVDCFVLIRRWRNSLEVGGQARMLSVQEIEVGLVKLVSSILAPIVYTRRVMQSWKTFV